MIVLIGFMGAGKSTVGELIAARLGRPHVDTDSEIERRAGKPIAEIFRTDGEAAFRTLEREVVESVLNGPEAVVSIGGGAVEDPATRALLERHDVVWLDVDVNEALARIAHDAGADRPMLAATDPAALAERRRAAYEGAAGMTVDTRARVAVDVAEEIVGALGESDPIPGAPRRVHVATPGGGYDVVIGEGLLDRAAAHIPRGFAEKAFVLTHPALEAAAAPLLDSLRGAGLATRVLPLPEGEGSKSVSVASRLWSSLAQERAHRDDVVVTFGGGVVGDVGGFVASTYMRGLPVAHVPTTLLAQVDAAIGGKTGVNLDGAKNLVGTIYQPRVVICDVALLRTCPPEEISSGLAEVVKAGFIADPSILDLVLAEPERVAALETEILIELVARAVAVKAAIVAADEHERGQRAFLNYGHTFAHAIESGAGLGRIRHGEAVAIGMVAAAHTAAELGRIDDSIVDLHREVLHAVGLPTGARLSLDTLKEAWQQDKKYRGGVRFVLLADLGQPEADISVPEEALEKALDRLAREDVSP